MMKILDHYIDQLLDKSTPQAPVWNIEKIKNGGASTWNYIDGCMIKAILELYHIPKMKNTWSLPMPLSTTLYRRTAPSLPMIQRNIIWTM